MISKIVTREQLIQKVNELKSIGKKVISTSGCFDILHAGHVLYLEEAKRHGDILIVMLNSDYSVRGLKGENRPIINERDRAIVVASLESVDYVCIFDESTPCDLISLVKPDVVIKGGDYQGKHIPEMDTVGEYGGRVEYVLLLEGHSSSGIISAILHSK